MALITFPSGEAFTRKGIDRVGGRFVGNSADVVDVQKYRAFRMQCLNTSLSILDRAILPKRAFIGIRLKRLDSIHRKLSRQGHNFKLSSLDDILGIRVICPSFYDVTSTRDSLISLPEHDKIKDYTQQEHYLSTGYRAVHHIMKFQQHAYEEQKITVRFEIQVRSYYQHQWAIWSEQYGENIKLGGRIQRTELEEKIIYELQSFSERISNWEIGNPDMPQDKGILPQYHGINTIAVVWRQPDGSIMPRVFHDDIDSAINQLNYWEQTFPHQRHNALLLAGISEYGQILKVLANTHPLYVLGRTLAPEYWMPD